MAHPTQHFGEYPPGITPLLFQRLTAFLIDEGLRTRCARVVPTDFLPVSCSNEKNTKFIRRVISAVTASSYFKFSQPLKKKMIQWCSEKLLFNQLSSEQTIHCQILHTVWYISGERLKQEIEVDHSWAVNKALFFLSTASTGTRPGGQRSGDIFGWIRPLFFTAWQCRYNVQFSLHEEVFQLKNWTAALPCWDQVLEFPNWLFEMS